MKRTDICDLFYIITCLKIYYFSINHNKTRTKSNRTSNSPRCLPVAVLSYVYNQAYLDRHTDSTDSSIIIANKGKFFTVSLNSTSLRRMGNGGLAPQNPQAWHWVVPRDNCFPTFRDTLVVCNRRDFSYGVADSYFRRTEHL